MSLKTILSGIVIGSWISITSAAVFTNAEVSTEVSSKVNSQINSLQQSQKTPQQKLLDLTRNYQKVCDSDECHKQLTVLRKYGRWGDAKSQLVVASAYLYGDGLEQDIEKAINWYERVAYHYSPNAGKYSLKAFHIMAKLYQEGIGVNKDLELATKYYDKLAAKHYGPVLFDRAFIEFEQDNLDKGVTLLEQASNSRFLEASYYLARMYQEGSSVEKDINKAALYYEKIVKRDYKDSRQRLEALINEIETSSSTQTEKALAESKIFISKLNSTLDIEIITVNSHTIDYKNAITSQLAQLKKIKRNFRPPTGSRIKGRPCGRTSHSCKIGDEESIQDQINENPMPAF